MAILRLPLGEDNMEPIPESDATVARALAAQETERAECIATLLANFAGYEKLAEQSEAIRKHFAYWGWIAVRGSAVSAAQFHYVALASHAAAQAGSDACATLERFVAPELLDDPYERRWWTSVASDTVRAYLDVLGNPIKAETALRAYGGGLQLVRR